MANENINVPLEDHALPEALTIFRDGKEIVTVTIDRKGDGGGYFAKLEQTGRWLFSHMTHEQIHASVNDYLSLWERTWDNQPHLRRYLLGWADRIERGNEAHRRANHPGPCCGCVGTDQERAISVAGSNKES